MPMQQSLVWCYCGRVGRFNGWCENHEGKELPKKKDKIQKFRGDSKWQKENGMFTNKGE